jgi:hypothetical protein
MVLARRHLPISPVLPAIRPESRRSQITIFVSPADSLLVALGRDPDAIHLDDGETIAEGFGVHVPWPEARFDGALR